MRHCPCAGVATSGPYGSSVANVLAFMLLLLLIGSIWVSFCLGREADSPYEDSH
jgi:hypothetical protein